MSNGIDGNFLDQFALPEGAAEALKQANLKTQAIQPGVSLMSGDDLGVPYRFFTYEDFNKIQTEKLGYEKFNDETMIEWRNDKYTHPTERVRHLMIEAPHLLRYNSITGKYTGRYAEAYERYMKGLSCEGTSLELWAAKYATLSSSEIATLKANDIHTVEQFAACPENRIRSKFPAEIIAGFERAIYYVAGKEQRAKTEEELKDVKETNAKLEKDIADMKAQLAAMQNQPLVVASESAKNKGGRPKKVKEVEE